MEKYCYDYPRPALTVDCLIFSKSNCGMEMLLIKRKHEPFKNHWAVPGGFMNIDETTDEAVKREVYEETGIEIENPEQFATFSNVQRDPRGRTVSVVYFLYIDREKLSPKAGDDASEINWFSLENLPELAFDHAEIIELACKKIFKDRM
jgi:8-oxo-dGTP diphosphatase